MNRKRLKSDIRWATAIIGYYIWFQTFYNAMRFQSVFPYDTQAGILTELNPGIGYSFQYTEEYLNADMLPISATLPKQTAVYSSEHLFPFFSNMLPEGADRRVICRSLKIDENDFFGLLEAMADKDFIGAVNIRRINND